MIIYKKKKNLVKRFNLCYANISRYTLLFILGETALVCKHCILVVGQDKNFNGFVLN